MIFVAAKKSSTSVNNDRGLAALAYLVFFLPLIFAPDSKFGKYHANQGLILLVFAIGINVIGMILPIIGWFLIAPIGNVVVLVFIIIGILNAVNGQQKPLPLIGKYTLIS